MALEGITDDEQEEKPAGTRVECGRGAPGGPTEGSGELPRRRFQPEAAEKVAFRDPGDAHDFPAAPEAGDDLHAVTGDAKRAGKKADERLVGPILEGGRGEADADRIPCEARHAFPRCTGQHVDRNRGGLPVRFPALCPSHYILMARSKRVFTTNNRKK